MKLAGEQHLAGQEPAVIVANHSSPLGAATLAKSLPGKLHLLVDDSHQLHGVVAGMLGQHKVTRLSAGNPGTLKEVLAAALGPGDRLVVFPQVACEEDGFGKLDVLAMRLGEKLVANRYVPVYVTHGKMATVTVCAPRQCITPVGLAGDGLRDWRENSLRMMLEEARFAAVDLEETVPCMLLRKAKEQGWGLPIFRQVLPEPRTITNRLLLRAGFALGGELARRHRPGERVGLMLPTTASTAATFFATHFAGLVPVMLNFGAGRANLVSACATAQVKTVYTAQGLLDKMPAAHDGAEALVAAGVQVEKLEQVRDTLPLGVKLGALLGLLMPERRLRQLPGGRLTPDSEAVVLFTSGSEGVPKGVVLSQRNLVANAAQVLCRLAVGKGDLLFNSLPVFHSFGLMGGVLLPVAGGVPSLQFPSPLMYREIPALISKERPSVIFSTSTFFAQYAIHARPADFESLRIIIAGGEKLKEVVREGWLRKFSKRVMEAYGVTETSPAIAVSTVHANKPGSIGLPLPGIKFRIEPEEGINVGGRLLVAGPNVMRGYMYADRPGEVVPPPDGWHDTGDIVTVDEQGYLFIVGRVKRFAKIAGEMVPLGRLEEIFNRLAGDANNFAVVAIDDAKRGEQLVFVTSSLSLGRKELLACMRDAGMPELWVPRTVLAVEEFPLLPTGKTDYPAVISLAMAARADQPVGS